MQTAVVCRTELQLDHGHMVFPIAGGLRHQATRLRGIHARKHLLA